MRRYHRSPSLPFLIAGIKPAGSSLSGLNDREATGVAKTSQNASGGAKTAPLAFLISLFLGGVFMGAGAAVAILEMGDGFPLHMLGLIVAAIGIIRCPEVE